ncbi:MAG: tetratricopeptide repeat protein [Gemmatimonadota bacterium]|nr:MAG: tetratricopeptide repeat protein [Gemmatimonadota bacterium]
MPGAVAKKKRKDELSQEDRLLRFVEHGAAWAQLHSRTVVIASVAVVLLVGGALYYRSYQESLRARAAIELNQLRATLTAADAVPRLTGFVARFDGTPSALEGRLLLAKLQLQAGQPQAALDVLEPIASKPVDLPTGYAVNLLLAEANKEAGAPERALERLDNIIDGAYVPYQRQRALAERARLLAELGRLEEAAAAYRRLVDEEGATGDLYRVRLGEIEAMIAAGVQPAPTSFAAPAPATPAGLPGMPGTGDSTSSGDAPPAAVSPTTPTPDSSPDSAVG